MGIFQTKELPNINFKHISKDPDYLYKIKLSRLDDNNALSEILSEMKNLNNLFVNDNFDIISNSLKYVLENHDKCVLVQTDYILFNFANVPAIEIKQNNSITEKNKSKYCYAYVIDM